MGKKAFLISKNTKGLLYCESDADSFQTVLTRFYHFTAKSVKSESEFHKEFYSFVNSLDVSDDLIIYCSGHGFTIDGELALQFEDNGYIFISDIFRRISASNAQSKLVILDCCRSAAALNNWNPPQNIAFRLLTASSNVGVASEMNDLEAGFLTYWLCRGLTENVKDVANLEGTMTITSLSKFIENQTVKYNSERQTNVAKPNLVGSSIFEMEFGNIKDFPSKNTQKVFLSIPTTEEDLQNRRQFISQHLDRKKYDPDWKVEFIPANEECIQLMELDIKAFEEKVSKIVEQSSLSVQLIQSEQEFNNDYAKIQLKLTRRENLFSTKYRRFYWLVNLTINDLRNKFSIYQNVRTEFLTSEAVDIFDKISLTFKKQLIPASLPTKPIIALIYNNDKDNDNETRIEVVGKIRKCPNFDLRECSVEIIPDKQDFKEAIKSSFAAVIFYGKTDSTWFKIHQDILLWQVKKSECHKIIFLDDPQADDKLKLDVDSQKFDKIIRGDKKQRINCGTFSRLR